MARVMNPRVVFWDNIFGQWSEEGVDSTSTVIDNGEFKVFNVRGEAFHLTLFGVAIDVNQNVSVWQKKYTRLHFVVCVCCSV